MNAQSKNSDMGGNRTSRTRATQAHRIGRGEALARRESGRSGASNARLSGIQVQDRRSALGQLIALGMLLLVVGAFVFTQLPGVPASRLRELQVPSHPGRAPDGLLLASPSQALQSMVLELGAE